MPSSSSPDRYFDERREGPANRQACVGVAGEMVVSSEIYTGGASARFALPAINARLREALRPGERGRTPPPSLGSPRPDLPIGARGNTR